MLDRLLDSITHIGNSSPLLLLVLVALEAVLSADNAIALAAIAQGLEDEKLRRQALNVGLIVAYVLRMGLILGASWVSRYWEFQLVGAAYLLWLVFKYFSTPEVGEEGERGPQFTSLLQAVPTIAFTDLAFSLDSVATAVAVSTDTLLIVIGATIGIVILRFMAELFIRWLEEFTHLEDAGYITIALVAVRLLARTFLPNIDIPEEAVVLAIGIIFAWGFSQRKQLKED
jgi:YkoY family integral membrane protein